MKEYLTRKNIGLGLAVLISIPIFLSAFGKLTGAQENLDMMAAHNIADWTMIIGIGEIISVILFLIPKTMRLGTMLLAAYFGGAIMFHMAHPNEEVTSFLAPSIFFTAVLIISWVRGLEMIELENK